MFIYSAGKSTSVTTAKPVFSRARDAEGSRLTSLQRLADKSPTVQRLAVLQAKAAEGKGVIQREITNYTWDIFQSARKHYKDGWGDSYGITTDKALKKTIANEGSDEEGVQSVDLGRCMANNQRETCNIEYENFHDNDTCHSEVFHCGPTTRY